MKLNLFIFVNMKYNMSIKILHFIVVGKNET